MPTLSPEAIPALPALVHFEQPEWALLAGGVLLVTAGIEGAKHWRNNRLNRRGVPIADPESAGVGNTRKVQILEYMGVLGVGVAAANFALMPAKPYTPHAKDTGELILVLNADSTQTAETDVTDGGNRLGDELAGAVNARLETSPSVPFYYFLDGDDDTIQLKVGPFDRYKDDIVNSFKAALSGKTANNKTKLGGLSTDGDNIATAEQVTVSTASSNNANIVLLTSIFNGDSSGTVGSVTESGDLKNAINTAPSNVETRAILVGSKDDVDTVGFGADLGFSNVQDATSATEITADIAKIAADHDVEVDKDVADWPLHDALIAGGLTLLLGFYRDTSGIFPVYKLNNAVKRFIRRRRNDD